jgi:predicted small metal-binding protein
MQLSASHLARVLAVGACAALTACHHHQRAELEVVLHLIEVQHFARIRLPQGAISGFVYILDWSIDLVESGGGNGTITAIDQRIHSSGHDDRFQRDEGTSPDLHGVGRDGLVDIYLPFDPTFTGNGMRKVSAVSWGTGWNFEAPADHVETLVIDMTVHYRDAHGEHAIHRTFGPGLQTEAAIFR